eukprot:2570893-Pyramimonas_sp.AAC.1
MALTQWAGPQGQWTHGTHPLDRAPSALMWRLSTSSTHAAFCPPAAAPAVDGEAFAFSAPLSALSKPCRGSRVDGKTSRPCQRACQGGAC